MCSRKTRAVRAPFRLPLVCASEAATITYRLSDWRDFDCTESPVSDASIHVHSESTIH